MHFDDVGGYNRLMNNFKKNFRDENWLEKECNADIILKKTQSMGAEMRVGMLVRDWCEDYGGDLAIGSGGYGGVGLTLGD